MAATENLSSAVSHEQSKTAADFQSRLELARRKGDDYAKETGVTFTLTQHKDEMTDKTVYEVESTQNNESGVEAAVDGICKIDPIDPITGSKGEARISFKVLVTDEAGKPTVHFAKQYGEFQYRIDNAPAQVGPPGFPFLFVRPEFSNELGPLIPTTTQVQTGWRLLISVDTDHGPLLVKIPLQDPAVQQLAALCK